MAEVKKSYYAIIPATVRYDSKLTPNAKLLYGEITALCNEKGYCWAGDGYFINLYECSRSTIQRWFKQLEENGYISRKVKYKEGTREIEHRYTQICDNPIPKNGTTPMPKNETDNITSFNTTVNNTKNIKPLSGKPDIVPYREIIDYLNTKTGKSFRDVESNKKFIRARWNEGNRLADFKNVIDTKTNEWMNGDMAKYLQPSTLFGSKFDQYLNQKQLRSEGYDTSEYDDFF